MSDRTPTADPTAAVGAAVESAVQGAQETAANAVPTEVAAPAPEPEPGGESAPAPRACAEPRGPRQSLQPAPAQAAPEPAARKRLAEPGGGACAAPLLRRPRRNQPARRRTKRLQSGVRFARGDRTPDTGASGTGPLTSVSDNVSSPSPPSEATQASDDLPPRRRPNLSRLFRPGGGRPSGRPRSTRFLAGPGRAGTLEPVAGRAARG